MTNTYECAKCSHPEFETEETSVTGSPRTALFNLESKKYAVVSCKRCGYSELFKGELAGLVWDRVAQQ